MLQVDQTCDLYDSPLIFLGGRGKRIFLRVRPAGVGFGRLVLLKLHKVLGGKDSNDSSYFHPNSSTHVEKHGSEKR